HSKEHRRLRTGAKRDRSSEIADLRAEFVYDLLRAAQHGDPDRAFTGSEAERNCACTDRDSEGPRLKRVRIDPSEGAPVRVDDPDVALTGGDEIRREAELDGVHDLIRC